MAISKTLPWPRATAARRITISPLTVAASLVDNLVFAGTTQTTSTNNVSGLTVGTITFNNTATTARALTTA